MYTNKADFEIVREGIETERRRRQSALHTVIMKDLGHVTKKQGMMLTIQHIVQELRKNDLLSYIVPLFQPGTGINNTV